MLICTDQAFLMFECLFTLFEQLLQCLLVCHVGMAEFCSLYCPYDCCNSV